MILKKAAFFAIALVLLPGILLSGDGARLESLVIGPEDLDEGGDGGGELNFIPVHFDGKDHRVRIQDPEILEDILGVDPGVANFGYAQALRIGFQFPQGRRVDPCTAHAFERCGNPAA